ncbi:MAG TPA: ATP-dependent DNA ligase [Actinomycetota bacterium]|nr:ATP-dependent DNA ligase [Actinomycetota bacterium]
MNLPVTPPVKPMLAKLVPDIPSPAGGAYYEPKFDGFRCITFKDGDTVELGSRNERPLTRYFPDVVAAVRRELPERCVVDGEIIVVQGGRLEFEVLQQRIHPAASRIKLLAEQTPAALVVFDLLALGDESLVARPFVERRTVLEEALGGVRGPESLPLGQGSAVFLSPVTTSVERAREWFHAFEGAGLDGVMAKPFGIHYVQDRRVMFKIKHERTADCVVGGFRFYKNDDGVGSLMLGLHDAGGFLWPIGVAASFSAAERQRLREKLLPYRIQPGEAHPWAPEGEYERLPGEPNRWSHGKDQSWEPLRPELVVEVAYDYMEGQRLRHVAHLRRWRPDRDPASCTFDQLDRPPALDLAEVLAAGSGPADRRDFTA